MCVKPHVARHARYWIVACSVCAPTSVLSTALDSSYIVAIGLLCGCKEGTCTEMYFG